MCVCTVVVAGIWNDGYFRESRVPEFAKESVHFIFWYCWVKGLDVRHGYLCSSSLC
jgi:hypothetical protein